MTTEIEMSDIIAEALYDVAVENSDYIDISTFEESGILTKNKGIVVKLWDGSEFQVTIVQVE